MTEGDALSVRKPRSTPGLATGVRAETAPLSGAERQMPQVPDRRRGTDIEHSGEKQRKGALDREDVLLPDVAPSLELSKYCLFGKALPGDHATHFDALGIVRQGCRCGP